VEQWLDRIWNSRLS